MKRIFNGIARALAMDMSDVHHIAIYGDLIAAKVQGRAASGSHGTDCSLINRSQKKKTKPLSSILSSSDCDSVSRGLCRDHLHNTM